MSDNLIVELLLAIRSDLARLDDRIGELTLRVGALEMEVGGLHRNFATLTQTQAHMSVRLDGAVSQIGRIERRIGLLDTALPPSSSPRWGPA
jgi:hypothetical protein